jgi:hypothetical protein
MQSLPVAPATVRFFIRETYISLLYTRFQNTGAIYCLYSDFNKVLETVSQQLEINSVAHVLDELNWAEEDTEDVIKDVLESLEYLLRTQLQPPRSKVEYLERLKRFHFKLFQIYGESIPDSLVVLNRQSLGLGEKISQSLRVSKSDVQRAIEEAKLKAQYPQESLCL